MIKTPYSGDVGFINFHLSDYVPILFVLSINAHKCLTEFLSPTLNCPIFNNTAYSMLLPNIITANISGYTAIVAIHSVDIPIRKFLVVTTLFHTRLLQG